MDHQNNQDSFEIQEPENYHSQIQKFSHQALVMECLRRAGESGSHELRSGWFNVKTNPATGESIKVYIEDTRAKFIESIKSCKMMMVCDFDEEAEVNVNMFIEELNTEKKQLLTNQTKWFGALARLPRENALSTYGEVVQGAFNSNLPWYQKFKEMEVECYRAIFEELNRLTKRLNFYEAENFEA